MHNSVKSRVTVSHVGKVLESLLNTSTVSLSLLTSYLTWKCWGVTLKSCPAMTGPSAFYQHVVTVELQHLTVLEWEIRSTSNVDSVVDLVVYMYILFCFLVVLVGLLQDLVNLCFAIWLVNSDLAHSKYIIIVPSWNKPSFSLYLLHIYVHNPRISLFHICDRVCGNQPYVGNVNLYIRACIVKRGYNSEFWFLR